MNPNQLPKEMPPDLLKKIIADNKVMVALAQQSFFHFFYIFFVPYIKHHMAPFHKEIFLYTEDESIKRFLLISFRGSAKSTICSTALPLWAIMGKLKKKHVVIASATQQRVHDLSANIAREVEQNTLLRKYLGPFEEQQGRWSIPVRVIPRYDARISFISAEEGIRGLREGPNRPDLIIVDDIEDQNSTKTKEGRDKTFQWLTGELIPAGDIGTKVLIVGNFLHEDSALMRVMKLMQEGKMDGKFLKVPIVDDDGNITWPGKFPSSEALESFRRGIGNEISWQREYLLRTINDDRQVVFKEWIHYYDTHLPFPPDSELIYIATGIDLAISQNETADYTAMVSARVYRYDGKLKIFILPHPINERLNFPQTVDRAKLIYNNLGAEYGRRLYIEDVGYQRSLIEQLMREGFYAEGIKLHGQDKYARLTLTTPRIQNGQILFPDKGAEDLIQQLVGFGKEKHDDLVDAFSLLILKIIQDEGCRIDIRWL